MININYYRLSKQFIFLSLYFLVTINNLFAEDNYKLDSKSTNDLEELISEPSIVKQAIKVPTIKADKKKKKLSVEDSVVPPSIKADKKKKFMNRQEEQTELPTFARFKLDKLPPSFSYLLEDTAPSTGLSDDSLSPSRFDLVDDGPTETTSLDEQYEDSNYDEFMSSNDELVTGQLSTEEEKEQKRQQDEAINLAIKKAENIITGKSDKNGKDISMREGEVSYSAKVRRPVTSNFEGVKPNVTNTSLDVGFNLLGVNSKTVFDYKHQDAGGNVQTMISGNNFSLGAGYSLKTEVDPSGDFVRSNTYKSVLQYGGEDYFLEGSAYTTTEFRKSGNGSRSSGGSVRAEESLMISNTPVKLEIGAQYSNNTTTKGGDSKIFSYNASVTALLQDMSVGIELSQEFNEIENALVGGYTPGFGDLTQMPQDNTQIMLRLNFKF